METDEHLDGSWENGTVLGSCWGRKDSRVRPLGAMHRMLQVSDSRVDLTTVAMFSFPLCTFFLERLHGWARPLLWRSLFPFVVDRYSRTWETSQSCTTSPPRARHPFLPSMHTHNEVCGRWCGEFPLTTTTTANGRGFLCIPLPSVLVATMRTDADRVFLFPSVSIPWFLCVSRNPCTGATVGSETFHAPRANTDGTVAAAPRLVYVLLPKPRREVPWIYAWCRWNRTITCRWNACRRSAIRRWVNGNS